MHPFVLPEHAKPRVGTSAPTAKISPVGDLVAGVEDIPYLDADFAMHELKEVRWETPRGRERGVQERSNLYRASCSFWEPDADERACIAAGGAVQVLDFRCNEPLIHVGAMWCAPPAMPNQHVIESVAMTMYEQAAIGAWSIAPESTKNIWRNNARKIVGIVSHNLKKD